MNVTSSDDSFGNVYEQAAAVDATWASRMTAAGTPVADSSPPLKGNARCSHAPHQPAFPSAAEGAADSSAGNVRVTHPGPELPPSRNLAIRRLAYPKPQQQQPSCLNSAAPSIPPPLPPRVPSSEASDVPHLYSQLSGGPGNGEFTGTTYTEANTRRAKFCAEKQRSETNGEDVDENGSSKKTDFKKSIGDVTHRLSGSLSR
jgi:hypothetical protein